MNEPSLAAAKAKAVRRVAERHPEEFYSIMRELGWNYTPDFEAPLTWRKRQWHRIKRVSSDAQ